tara:strand:- start:853 stop:1563 length:711 start_codon:yes stop_codon:yes gene_type:complete
MNKLTTIIASSMIAMLSFVSAANSFEYKVGITGQSAAYYGNATETLKDTGVKTSDEAIVAFSTMSGFAEIGFESAYGLKFGLEYTPEMISFKTKSRVIMSTLGDSVVSGSPEGEDSGTQNISAAVEDMITAYLAIPIMDSGVHIKVGYSQASLVTSETLATGSTYKDVDLSGATAGVYYDGSLGDMAFYRLEGAYNTFDDLLLTGSEEGIASSGSYNKIDAELGGVAAKLSVGLQF